MAFLQKLPEFAHASVVETGCWAFATAGMHREYRLTGDDVRRSSSMTPPAAIWPIEYWDPQRGVSLEYLPDGGTEIPLRR